MQKLTGLIRDLESQKYKAKKNMDIKFWNKINN